ncbi:MAG: DUF4118 domain-containing protein [Lachnospiraceae bacterium]|nr:DUF4118 domain-containing protein [Lachnospiraceae bacterium]
MKQQKIEIKGNLVKLSWKDSLITIGILTVATICCFILRRGGQTDSHVPLVFVLAVLLVSRFTNSYFYGMFSSAIAVIGVNYIFTYPYFHLNFTLNGYPLTFVAMFSVSIVVSMLTTQIKQQEKIRAEIEKERMRGNLLRAVSHDIRTPLTSIVGAVSAVAENHDKLSKEKILTLLGDVKEEAQWLVRVVENLLLVTRIDSDSAKVAKEPEMVEEILAEAVVKFKKRFPEAPVKTEMPEEVLFVPMDAMLIEQVLCNLMENAVVHGGVVSEILLGVRKEGDYAVFSVKDDGVGIGKDVLPRLLKESIYNGNETNMDGKRNMGIGLTVCKSIICAHGGSVEAYNRKAGGAAFEFRLPIKEE